ncbi:MAG: trypsin-like peptidase domain-containing protein [Nitrospinae bacterium]|nr:trypsin-like peptidase domain-containing protein [Nitrospinota bacterium]
MRNNKNILAWVCLTTALIFATAQFALAEVKKGQPRPITPRGDLSASEKETIEVFKNTSPSVVYITSIGLAQNLFTMNIFEIPKGTGSGFIWDSDGHIVTNYHVIQDANKIDVTLVNGTKWKATLVGVAPEKDLAVLKITAPIKQLVPIPVGDARILKVGMKVYAIGNPFGLDYSMTSGIVSALNREVDSMNGGKIHGAIQTDAAINPGNSGGPLLDSAGRLIGMNTAIFSPSGASAGVGFAVPVEVINRFVPQLIDFGKIIRPGIGISVAHDDVAERFGIHGVIVFQVIQGSPAEAAKLRPTTRVGNQISFGDVIVSVNETKIRNTADLTNAFDALKAGDVVKLGLLRDKGTEYVSVPLAEMR